MASDDEISRTVTELLREVSAARNDLLKADEVRRIAADEFRKMVEVRGRPLVEVVEKLDKALKDQDQPRGPGQMLTSGRPWLRRRRRTASSWWRAAWSRS